MVKVKFTYKNGKTKVVNFPRNTLVEIKHSAKGINPKIKKVEYYRKKR